MESESKLPATVEKAGRQVLHQLKNLQKIWQPVLPQEVYLRAIGTLANSVLEELLSRVTAMEDIPAAAALQLADQCQNVTDTLPLLFAPIDVLEFDFKSLNFGNLFCFCLRRREKGEREGLVIHHIQLWPRFEEQRHLLGAGLRDIESRWSMGKGPLAVHFAADEVKQLVRDQRR